MTLRWDLANLAAIDENVTSIEARLGPVDVLINNTGGPPPTRLSANRRSCGASTSNR
jgi:3-oxoacyl-[acyl-carrier protein] reductase